MLRLLLERTPVKRLTRGVPVVALLSAFEVAMLAGAHLKRLDARERLHQLLFEELRRTYHKLEKDPRALDMARTISQERPQFANWMLEKEREILVDLMVEAERRGEFTIEDKVFTAEMVQSATMKFRYPQLWTKLTLPKLERELDGVLHLLVFGLCPHMTAERRIGAQGVAAA